MLFLNWVISAWSFEGVEFPSTVLPAQAGYRQSVMEHRNITQDIAMSVGDRTVHKRTEQIYFSCYRQEKVVEYSQHEVFLHVEFPYCYRIQGSAGNRLLPELLPVAGQSYMVRRSRNLGTHVSSLRTDEISPEEQNWVLRSYDEWHSSGRLAEVLRGKRVGIGDDIDELVEPLLERFRLLSPETDTLLGCKVYLASTRQQHGEQIASISIDLQLRRQQPQSTLLFTLKGELAVKTSTLQIVHLWFDGPATIQGQHGTTDKPALVIKGSGVFQQGVFVREDNQ